MPKLVDRIQLVLDKTKDYVLSVVFNFWLWLGRQLQIEFELEPSVVDLLAGLIETNKGLQGRIADVEQALAATVAENDSLRGEAVSYANLIVSEGYGTKTGPNRPNNNRKLSEREVFEIRNMKRQGWKNSELARAFDVNPATVSRIVRGQYHKTQVAV